MIIKEFKGITSFHDGRPVSDYINMIPLGDTCIDRPGEDCDNYHRGLQTGEDVVETFIDSKHNIYVATTHAVYKVIDNGYQTLLSGATEFASFCESSTSPSQVYCNFGGRVYYWNTEQLVDNLDEIPEAYRNRVKPFIAIKMPIGDFGTFDIDQNVGHSDYEFWPDNLPNNKFFYITHVTWYQNRLVCVQKSKSTVWLSPVDPSRWIVPVPGQNAPMSIFTLNEQDNLWYYDFFTTYYKSTASATNLNKVVSFGGMLVFCNDTSIEMWSATGNYDNPIQLNTNSVINVGVVDAIVIVDILYMLCNDGVRRFVATLNPAGQLQVVSNQEIEQRMNARTIRKFSVHDKSIFICYGDSYNDGYALTDNGFWWHPVHGKSRKRAIWTIGDVNGTIYHISLDGSIITTNAQHRHFADGETIRRSMLGMFNMWSGRKIVRELEVVCDSGIWLKNNIDKPKAFMHVSDDRGQNFGRYFYRNFGSNGNNNHVLIWRNISSSNSILVEFGTGDEIRFQIYQIRVEIA